MSGDGGVEELGEGPFVTVMGPESRIGVWVKVAGDSLSLDTLEVVLPT